MFQTGEKKSQRKEFVGRLGRAPIDRAARFLFENLRERPSFAERVRPSFVRILRVVSEPDGDGREVRALRTSEFFRVDKVLNAEFFVVYSNFVIAIDFRERQRREKFAALRLEAEPDFR